MRSKYVFFIILSYFIWNPSAQFQNAFSKETDKVKDL